MDSASRIAWLTRILDRAFPVPTTLGNTIGREMAIDRILAEARKRDPLIDPAAGDRIIVHRNGPMLTFTVRKTFRMRTRGSKKGGPLVDHVAVHIESRDGSKVEQRGRNYTLAKLRELFAMGRCQVLEVGK